jgi:hypothetical protein
MNGQLQWNKKTTLAYNQKDTKVRGQQQFGGVAVTSIGNCMHRDLTTGEDTSGLTGLAWHHYQGKYRIALRVVSPYQPNGPGSGGPCTVYAKHVRHLCQEDKNDLLDP